MDLVIVLGVMGCACGIGGLGCGEWGMGFRGEFEGGDTEDLECMICIAQLSC